MDGSRLLFLGHAPTHEFDKGILERGFALLHASDLAARSLDDPHDATERRVARELEAESVDAILLGDAGRRDAVNRSEGVQEAAAGAELKIDHRILLDPLLQLAGRSLGVDGATVD